MTNSAHYQSPLGLIRITGSESGIQEIRFVRVKKGLDNTNKHVDQCLRELDDYFKGKKQDFSVALDIRGTKFQKQVWRALRKIGYGRTTCYEYLARSIGKPKACRAVGQANHVNNLPIIIPCHRVIGKNGKLTGYAGGLHIKKWLLEHEKGAKNSCLCYQGPEAAIY
ncbi:MAG: hypothetical protein ACD_62C00680G0006 [uncultured bacterium]|nr:MAG: hypothetical protein ACD_62C00680G0006 [uncultured bacterium]